MSKGGGWSRVGQVVGIVHSLEKDDIAFEDIDEKFGEEYKLFLKRDQGRIDSYVNHCLLWLNMLMYKAVDRSIIRFNPI